MKTTRIMPFIILSLFGLYTLEFGIVGILPLVLERYGVSIAEAGALLGLFAFTGAIVGPVAVLISSRFDRKSVLIASLSVFTVSSGISAYAPTFEWLMACRIVAAVFHPMFYAAALSTATSIYPAGQEGRAVSKAVFGSNLGLIAGLPLMSWFATAFSYQTAFLFCGAVTLIALLGLVFGLPRVHRHEALSFGNQLLILKKPALWLNLATAVFILAALFSIYSYAAEYFRVAIVSPSDSIGLFLTIFGVGGVLGNMIIGRFLDRHLVRVTLFHPVFLVLIFSSLAAAIHAPLAVIALVALIWGAAHTTGLVNAQVWVRSVTADAPDFATSLFVTAANAGVLIGSSVGGAYLTYMGLNGAIWCGCLFAVLSLATSATKVLIYGRYGSRNEAAATAAACSRSW